MHDTTPGRAGEEGREQQRQGGETGSRQRERQAPVHPRRISEEEAQRIPPDYDPDDPVCP